MSDRVDDGPENLVLRYLRRIDERMDRLENDVRELKHRFSSFDGQLAHLRVDMAQVSLDMAAMSSRMDRLEGRLDRIERRLDLAPA